MVTRHAGTALHGPTPARLPRGRCVGGFNHLINYSTCCLFPPCFYRSRTNIIIVQETTYYRSRTTTGPGSVGLLLSITIPNVASASWAACNTSRLFSSSIATC